MTYKEANEILNYILIDKQDKLKLLPKKAAKHSYLKTEIKALVFALDKLQKKEVKNERVQRF